MADTAATLSFLQPFDTNQLNLGPIDKLVLEMVNKEAKDQNTPPLTARNIFGDSFNQVKQTVNSFLLSPSGQKYRKNIQEIQELSKKAKALDTKGPDYKAQEKDLFLKFSNLMIENKKILKKFVDASPKLDAELDKVFKAVDTNGKDYDFRDRDPKLAPYKALAKTSAENNLEYARQLEFRSMQFYHFKKFIEAETATEEFQQWREANPTKHISAYPAIMNHAKSKAYKFKGIEGRKDSGYEEFITFVMRTSEGKIMAMTTAARLKQITAEARIKREYKYLQWLAELWKMISQIGVDQ